LQYKAGWWFGPFWIFPLRISSSQLTNSIIFQRGRAQPLTRKYCWTCLVIKIL
jgi:hypothetical protein